MQSKNLQYMRPNEKASGGKNHGVVGQYPYFAPDMAALKKAPKMTKADELYLKKFMQARDAMAAADLENSILDEKKRKAQQARKEQSEEEDGKVNVVINQRLYLERNKNVKAENAHYRNANGEKISLTNQIFGDHRYFQEQDDTGQDQDMEDYVMQNWDSAVFYKKPEGDVKKPAKKQKKEGGNTGNVVPFFPTDWKKNANDVFNLILNGQEPTEDVYDEVTHAAVHKKVENQLAAQYLKPGVIENARPTSGKHYARDHAFAKRKGSLNQPNHDPIMSNVARNYEKQKKVEGLLNRLANYMAGDIPDQAELDEIFEKEKEKVAVPETAEPFDDATTNFTKDDINLQNPTERAPLTVEANEDEVPVDEDEQSLLQAEEVLNQIPEEDLGGAFDLDQEEISLPNIYASIQNKDRFKKKREKPEPKTNSENLFIYKDFDTKLTAVRGPVKNLPQLSQTTKIAGQDLIRDRLLSYDIRQGNHHSVMRDGQKRQLDMNERSQILQQRKLAQSQIHMHIPKLSINMRHKAFWVQNQNQVDNPYESGLPSIRVSRNASEEKLSERKIMSESKSMDMRMIRQKERGPLETELRSNAKTKIPVPISKRDKITQKEGDMNLMQQYVMIKGKLQPALKYIAPIPMFNRYKVKNGGIDKFDEIMTYPTVSGDINIKNKHQGVNFDDRDIPEKILPKEHIDKPKQKDLEGVMKVIQHKNIKYNKQYYTEVQRKDKRLINDDSDEEFEDPRSLADIEAENIALKEQYIHQMMTFENYLVVAQVWHAEQQLQSQSNQYENMPKYNLDELQSDININYKLQDQVAEDGWIDYGNDNVNTIPPEEEVERHEEKYNAEAVKQAILEAKEEEERRQLEASQSKSKMKGLGFLIPPKVANIGNKIKGLFYSHLEINQQKLVEKDKRSLNQTMMNRTRKSNLGQMNKTGKMNYNHYEDSSYEHQIHQEVLQLRQLLDTDFKNQRIVDLENKIRDNKRIIVNYMTENVFELRFGFSGNEKDQKKIDRDELLTRMVNSRMKRIRIMGLLIDEANKRKTAFMVWGVHSDLIDYRRQAKLMQDIVILAQEKNLLAEMQGKKKFIKVGEIERQLDWPIRMRSKYGPIDANDYYSRKLRGEIDEHNAILGQIEADAIQNNIMMKEMKAFISAIFGNDGWVRLVEARWLRKLQGKHLAEYDPSEKERVPIYVKSGYLPHVPRQIQDELPTHDGAQFGGFQQRSRLIEPQMASQNLYDKMVIMNKNKYLISSKKKLQQNKSVIARQAIKEQRQFLIKNQRKVDKLKGNPQGAPHRGHNRGSSQEIIRIDSKDNDLMNAGDLIDASFNNEGSEGHLTVNGSIRGSKFGSLYDQKLMNTHGVEGIGKLGGTGDEKDALYDTFGNKKLTDVVKEDLELKKAKERELAELDLKKIEEQKRIKQLAEEEEARIKKLAEEEEARIKKLVEDEQAKKNQEGAGKEEKKGKDGSDIAVIAVKKVVEEIKKPKVNWLERIRKEQLEKQQRENLEKEKRSKRLQKLLDSDSEDNEDTFDYKGLQGDKLQDFLVKIETHVMAEQKILDAWTDKDQVKKAASKDKK